MTTLYTICSLIFYMHYPTRLQVTIQSLTSTDLPNLCEFDQMHHSVLRAIGILFWITLMEWEGTIIQNIRSTLKHYDVRISSPHVVVYLLKHFFCFSSSPGPGQYMQNNNKNTNASAGARNAYWSRYRSFLALALWCWLIFMQNQHLLYRQI
jgi:hypothetical protein